MDVLMVTAELSPYVRATPAGDVVLALTKGLRQLGHRVTLAMPRYAAFEEHGLLLARRLTPLSVEGADVTVFDGQHSSGAELALFDIPGLGAPGALGAPEADARQVDGFRLLGRAAAALVAQRRDQQPFDVVHAHDWPGGLVAASLASGPPVVLSVYHPRPAPLASGLERARIVVCPSPSYAATFSDAATSGALASTFAALAEPVVGVTSGLDYATYNPATDPALEARYDAEESDAKARTKGVVQRELRLELDIARPLVLFAAPLDAEHGADVVLEALTDLLRHPISIVVAATAPGTLDAGFRAAAAEYPGSVAFVEARDAALVRRLHAAADLALVVPRDAPCELGQLVAQRYGAIPVAYAAGTALDTVVDVDAALETGTGFLFDRPERIELVGAVERALAGMATPDAWVRLRRRVMRLDLGWDRPARRYAQLYRRALEPVAS
ncbi:MAG TPA: glycogen/starch synthase [Polyangiaceae bacterium]|nr:glycogen/starch synthase [Polyangiaceae bacterium]